MSTVIDDLANGSSESGSEFSSLPIEGSSLTKDNEQELKELIQSGQYAKALKLVHVFKENIPGMLILQILNYFNTYVNLFYRFI